MADEPVAPNEIGEADTPPVAEAPYKIVFEADNCIAAGKCAAVSDNWEMNIETGIAQPSVYFFDDADLEHNVLAAEVCSAKKDAASSTSSTGAPTRRSCPTHTVTGRCQWSGDRGPVARPQSDPTNHERSTVARPPGVGAPGGAVGSHPRVGCRTVARSGVVKPIRGIGPGMSEDPEAGIEDPTALVDRNGLVKLFANRVRARVLVTLFYADEPLSAAAVADHAGIYQSDTIEALEALETFDILAVEGEADPTYAVDRSDELVADIRTLAESATNRFYDGSD
jgi:hypothetical protein